MSSFIKNKKNIYRNLQKCKNEKSCIFNSKFFNLEDEISNRDTLFFYRKNKIV